MTCSLARFGRCAGALVTCADCGARVCQWHSALRPFTKRGRSEKWPDPWGAPVKPEPTIELRHVCFPRCGVVP